MGIFFRTFAAVVVADAIDRHARGPVKYWYPDRSGLPRTGGQIPYVPAVYSPAPALAVGRRPAGWDLEHPERPR